MMAKVFRSVSSKNLAEMIRGASQRVAIVAPGIHDEVGKALCDAATRLGQTKVDVVLDLDEKVFRLGYGSIEAVKRLKESGITVRCHGGLRIGLVICDESAWAFSPVALYIETEPGDNAAPNAISLSHPEALRLLMRISESARLELAHTAPDPVVVEEARSATVEMSVFSENSSKLAEVSKNLADAPPVPFDISRQVQVFEPYIQYVDLKLQGCSIQKHKIQLPKSIVGLASNKDFENRLSTTFNLLEKSSTLSAKHLEDKVRELRKIFTRIMGKHGRVMLKAQRKRFDQEVDKIRKMIISHQEKIEAELVAELATSMNQLIDYYLPIVLQRPPTQLLAQISGGGPTKQQACAWLANEIGKCIPDSNKLMTRMELECLYKDVSYETLKDKDLAASLKKEFPYVNWDKPFSEFTAAKSAEDLSKT